MAILGSEADPTAIRRILLASSLGAVFGFQSWWLAKHGIGVSILWCGPAWILFGNVFLGFSTGLTTGSECWWKRGLTLGSVFSIPSVLGVLGQGVRCVPDGVASMAGWLVAGPLIAWIADTAYPSGWTSNGRKSPALRQPLDAADAISRNCSTAATRQRLDEAKACLESLAAERVLRGDSSFGKDTEDRIIWNELLYLELQDIDDHVSRLSKAAPSNQAPKPSSS